MFLSYLAYEKPIFFYMDFYPHSEIFRTTSLFIKKSAKLVVLQAITELSTSNLFQINFPSTNTKMLMFSGFNWILQSKIEVDLVHWSFFQPDQLFSGIFNMNFRLSREKNT